jgi:hypothetical protein
LVGRGGAQIAPRTDPFLIHSQALAIQTRACWVAPSGDNHQKSNSGGVDSACITSLSEHWVEFHALSTIVQAILFIRKLHLLYRYEEE